MNKFFRFATMGLVALSTGFVTSCDDDDTEGTYQDTIENIFKGQSTLSAMGQTVSYENSLTVLDDGKTVKIDSICYGSFNIKDFKIQNLVCNSKKNTGTITLDKSRQDTIECGGEKFVILDADCTIEKTSGKFKFQIKPVRMPFGNGFEFVHEGGKTLLDE